MQNYRKCEGCGTLLTDATSYGFNGYKSCRYLAELSDNLCSERYSVGGPLGLFHDIHNEINRGIANGIREEDVIKRIGHIFHGERYVRSHLEYIKLIDKDNDLKALSIIKLFWNLNESDFK